MIRRLVLFGLLLSTTILWAAETMSYSLQQVTSVKNGGKYVFVQNGRAILHSESNNGLATAEIDVTSPIDASGAYVWILRGTEGFYYLTYQSGEIVIYLRNNKGNSTASADSSPNLFFVSEFYSPTVWQFTFNNGLAKISNTITGDNNGRSLSISDNICYAYKDIVCNLTVYQLVPQQYTRTEIASDQIGTVCLPFATESYSGATFYTLLCKENDASGNPAKVYYEQVTGQLEAGKPYVYVPDKDAAALSFTAAEGSYVSKPNNYNGFVGTFADVVDDTNTHTLEGNYLIYNNQIQKCGTNCGLRAYRAYIKMSEVAEINQVAAPTRRLLVMGQGKEPEYMDPTPGVMTGIQNTVYTMHSAVIKAECAMLNGRIVIIRGGEHYDLTGRRVE